MYIDHERQGREVRTAEVDSGKFEGKHAGVHSKSVGIRRKVRCTVPIHLRHTRRNKYVVWAF